MPPTTPTPTGSQLALMKEAADLRAQGNSWQAIANRIGRKERCLRYWRDVYPRIWRRLLRAAEEDTFQHVSGMAINILSNLLIDKEDTHRAQNCQFLIAKRREQLLAEKRLRHKAFPPKPPAAELDDYRSESIAEAAAKPPEQLEKEIIDYAALLQANASDQSLDPAASACPAPPG